ncbi:RNA polymerase sigma factor [Porticoccaceae bacterium LTM1]|nr:RNA polymerase sigma factor [Porticoccaceae bacterium LTM1]
MAKKKSNVVDMNGRPLVSQKQVLEQLFREHGAVLRAFLAPRISTDMDLDDLVQEVFLRLARVEDLTERMATNRGSTLSYLITIGVNLILDIKKHNAVVDKHAYLGVQNSEEETLRTAPDVIACAREDLQLVEQVIFQLPPVWRKVFLLSRVEGMTYKEIAQKMNVSVKQVEKYMSKTLKKIRDAFIYDQKQEANDG